MINTSRSRVAFRGAVLFAVSVPLVALLASSGNAKPGDKGKADLLPRYGLQSVTALEAMLQGLRESREASDKARAERPAPGPSAVKEVKKEGEEEEEGFEQLEARLYWIQMRAFPNDVWDWSRGDRAIEQRNRMPTTVSRPGGSAPSGATHGPSASLVQGIPVVPILPNGATWEFVGPRNWNNGTITGRINGVAIDPSNSRVAYIASAGGGVWKTLDGGGNWTPLTDQQLDRLQTTCVAVNPRSVRQVLVGLGDHHAQRDPGRGIARSTDGGTTWSYVGAGMSGSSVSQIVFDPDIPSLVVASSSAGVFRSVDAGANWKRVSTVGGDWTSITVGARNLATGVRRYYSANRSNNAAAGIYRSDDRGLTWKRLDGAPLRFVTVPGLGLTGIEVTASPVNPDTVFFSEGDAQAEDGRIWRSDRAGDDLTWIDINGTLIGDHDWFQVWYDHYLAASSRTDTFGNSIDVLYSGLSPAQASASGNSNWVRYNPVHVDQQGIGFDPRDRTKAIITNDGGAYLTSFDGTSVGVTASLNANLGVTQFYHADWHPTNPDIMLGGTQDNSTALSQGNLFNWLVKIGGDGMSVGIVEERPTTMYGSTQQVGSIWRSTNGGTSFGSIYPTAPDYADGFGGDVKPWKTILSPDPMLESPNYLNQTSADPRTAPVVFVATDRLWRHGIVDKDMDTSLWTERLGGQVLTNGTTGAFVTCIQVVPVVVSHPNNPGFQIVTGNVVYVGSSDGAVWMTLNAVRTGKLDSNNVPVFVASLTGDVKWQKLNLPATGTQLPVGSVGALSVNPSDPFDVIVGIGGNDPRHLWRCANTRSAWAVPQTPWVWTPQSGFQGSAAALPDALITGVTRDPQDPQNSYFVSTDYGVFGSVDGGSRWANVGGPYGLPNVEITTIKALGSTGYLNLATFGRGLWRIPMADKSGFTLNLSAGVRRVGNTLEATVSVENVSDTTDAANVSITQSSMRTERTNINVNTSTPMPLVLTPTLVAGDTTSGIVRFSNGALTPGTFVNLKATVQTTVNGSLRTFVQTFRLRLP